MLGSAQGTPTIRFFKPDSRSKRNKKKPLEYSLARDAPSLVRFAKLHMPSFVVSVSGGSEWAEFEAKAQRNGLPAAVLFTKSSKTSSVFKAVSVEYRK